jgi:biopolymer transport protein ExbB/TolQ
MPGCRAGRSKDRRKSGRSAPAAAIAPPPTREIANDGSGRRDFPAAPAVAGERPWSLPSTPPCHFARLRRRVCANFVAKSPEKSDDSAACPRTGYKGRTGQPSSAGEIAGRRFSVVATVQQQLPLSLEERPGDSGAFVHAAFVGAGLMAAVVMMWAIYLFAPEWVAVMLLDIHRSTYPITIQTFEWLAFGFCLGELAVRVLAARADRAQLRLGLLPEDEMTILQAPELRRIHAAARAALRASTRPHFLPRLIQRIVLQFQANRSVSEATAILTASLELFQHEIDLRYSMVRYTIWVLPTLGFVGTVLGISQALRFAGAANPRDPTLLHELTQILAVKFDTTLVALSLAAILVLAQHLIQRYEEAALNKAGQYCIDNLINRLLNE